MDSDGSDIDVSEQSDSATVETENSIPRAINTFCYSQNSAFNRVYRVQASALYLSNNQQQEQQDERDQGSDQQQIINSIDTEDKDENKEKPLTDPPNFAITTMPLDSFLQSTNMNNNNDNNLWFERNLPHARLVYNYSRNVKLEALESSSVSSSSISSRTSSQNQSSMSGGSGQNIASIINKGSPLPTIDEKCDQSSVEDIATTEKWACTIFYFGYVVLFVVLMVIFYDTTKFSESTPTSINETMNSSSSEGNYYNKSSDHLLPSTSDESKFFNSSQNNDSLATCFTDPRVINSMEWEAYERGDDPSIPRTYHFCPNSIMNVYDVDKTLYKFIYTTGDTHPLFIFRSNVNILCGFDGDYSNNCTFTGGFIHIRIRPRPIQLSYKIGSVVENVTIEGFRFTGASNGVNIALRANQKSSAMIKNCRFDNNDNMAASLLAYQNDIEASTARIQNCTFENNSFSYNLAINPVQGESTHVQASGAIIMYNSIGNPDTIVKLFVSNCVFQNNTFLIEPDTFDFVSSAVVNLFDPVTELEITDSCFIENRGYSSALILLGTSSFSSSDDVLKEEEGNINNVSHHIYYRSNSFYDNVASDLYKESCILNSRSIDLMVEPGEPFKQNVKESCDEYFESEEESNDTSSSRYATCSLHDVDF